MQQLRVEIESDLSSTYIAKAEWKIRTLNFEDLFSFTFIIIHHIEIQNSVVPIVQISHTAIIIF